MRSIFIFLFSFLLISCKEDTLPKPKAYLNLTYAESKYKTIEVKRPYSFEVSKNALIKNSPNNWLQIKYPTLKASIDITYRKIDDNLKELLSESEKLVFKHTVKAEQIVSNNFVNADKKVFGSIYEISGNAASQIQFHITDSTHNFIKRSFVFLYETKLRFYFTCG